MDLASSFCRFSWWQSIFEKKSSIILVGLKEINVVLIGQMRTRMGLTTPEIKECKHQRQTISGPSCVLSSINLIARRLPCQQPHKCIIYVTTDCETDCFDEKGSATFQQIWAKTSPKKTQDQLLYTTWSRCTLMDRIFKKRRPWCIIGS